MFNFIDNELAQILEKLFVYPSTRTKWIVKFSGGQ